jgi:hypothetical protein
MNRKAITKTRPLALTTAAGAVLAAAVLAGSPAYAATSGGCTVTPLTPTFAGFNSSGVKQVNYAVRISCAADRSVQVLQRRYEEDGAPNPDDLTGSVSFTRSFSETKTITVRIVRSLPDTENGNEEVYHAVRFRVTSNGVTSPWTSFERSSKVSIPN